LLLSAEAGEVHEQVLALSAVLAGKNDELAGKETEFAERLCALEQQVRF